MSNILNELKELFELYGTFIRPDASGVRMGFTGRPGGKMPLTLGDEYPYDKDINVSYSPHGQVPRAAMCNPWDDAHEAVGAPSFFSKSNSAQIGSATGIPGAGGQWANNPVKPWESGPLDDCCTDYDTETTNDQDDFTLDVTAPKIEPNINLEPNNWHDQTDDELEKNIDRIFGRDSNVDLVKKRPENDIFATRMAGQPLSTVDFSMIPTYKKSAWSKFLNNKK